ncbi:MAG: twin-arginine translocation pathway signal protein, partial [Betaproteobacteria bacterium]|nr:twin-arginine translocation pathway signal protein [Betaproteobacteria bacterium]
VFSSDNGGERYSDNWPHVGGKMDLSEGGIRVPWIVRWTGQVPAASLSAQTCITMDFSASFLDAAGVKAHPDFPLDGQSLLEVFRHPAHQFERPLFWRMKHRNQAAHRKGTWKYLKIDHHEYLFDLEHDPRERANLRDRHPDQFQSMKAAWQAWDATMPEIPDGASVSLGYGLESMPAR